ncbi:MAG: hypothetical protein KTR16_11940 [Acidiferrobacterales bacterium]|nr:hypothetical protein [Acidiferrobacterales bacterium]
MCNDAGPYCSSYNTSSARKGGIWLDGTNVYDVDGQFILDLPTIYPNEEDPDRQWRLQYEDTVSVINFVTAENSLEGRDVEALGACFEAYSDEMVDGQPTTTVLIPLYQY